MLLQSHILGETLVFVFEFDFVILVIHQHPVVESVMNVSCCSVCV